MFRRNAPGSAARMPHARVLYECSQPRVGQKEIVCLLAFVSDRDERTTIDTMIPTRIVRTLLLLGAK